MFLINKKFKKHPQYLFIAIIFIVLFFWYLYRLDKFPIFADEAIYLHWAKRVILKQENPFISMFDGKPPLFIWISALLSKFSNNLLFTGRLVSVLSLFISVAIIFKHLLKKSFSWAASSLIIILASPFIFFHSRMALMDTLLSSLIILSIFSWSQSHNKKGLIAGALLGLAFYTKTTALFILPLPILSLLFKPRDKKNYFQIIAFYSLFILVVSTLKISEWFPYLFLRSRDFTFSFQEIFSGQLNHVLPNLKSLASWLNFYLSWPVIAFSILGALKGIKKKSPLIINITMASILFFLPTIILGKIIAPRYYLLLGFTLPILAAYSLSFIGKNIKTIFLSALLAIFIPINYLNQTNPFISHLPKIDNHQYLEDWSSGIGILNVSDRLNNQAEEHSVKLLTEGYFGTLPDALFVFQNTFDGKQLEIVGVGSVNSKDFKKELESSQAEFNYYVGNKNRISDLDRQSLKLIDFYGKKNDGPPLELYLINEPQQ